MTGWRQTTLGEVIALQRGHDLTEEQRSPGMVPVIGSAGQNGWHNVARAKGPGVTVGRSGASAGVVTYVGEAYWPHNTVLYVRDFKGNAPQFVASLLCTLPLAEMNSGAAQASLNRNFLYPLPVHLPPLDIQRRISSILGTYEGLIEVNRRRVALLENMARGLFEEWFVKFRFPGHETPEMSDTPDGEIPNGWSAVKVSSILRKVRRAKKIQKQDYVVNGAIPCIDQGADFIGGYTDDTDALINEPLPLCVFGDHTRVLKFVTFPFASGADGTQLLSPTDEITPEFLYYSLIKVDLSNHHYARHFKFLKEEAIVLPPTKIVTHFTTLAKPLLDQVQNLRFQNRALAASRDLLLPRLISGQLSVKAAERELEEAA